MKTLTLADVKAAHAAHTATARSEAAKLTAALAWLEERRERARALGKMERVRELNTDIRDVRALLAVARASEAQP